jgi:adenosine deaminase
MDKELIVPFKAQARHWLRALPKVSLHCHLEGTLHPASFRELAAKAGEHLAGALPERDEELYVFTDFMGFLRCFRGVCAVLREPEDYGRLAREYAREATRQGVVAAETFVAPSAWLRLHPGLDLRAAFEAIRAALDAEERAGGPRVELICDITRNFGPAEATRVVSIARAMRDLGVIGIGLGGDEAHFPAELFTTAFARARRAGLRCVAHAGEFAGPPSVRAAIDLLGAERIGHGVRAIEDPYLVAELARRGIALEQAPTSNRLTGAVSGAHPMAHFVAEGVRVAIDADDPALFSTGILDEYERLAVSEGDAFVFDRAQDALAASFASAERKRETAAALEHFAVRATVS